ncbi:hypothetical protein Taro_028103 [Colocasia esculenta]|uniref:Uncharacterized protein n=1 Tax=Colocasia esculenta TaxID=4460 RepID=A0A843VW95_COLES|nr:hypothetical protein [Colocasia esculenta]
MSCYLIVEQMLFPKGSPRMFMKAVTLTFNCTDKGIFIPTGRGLPKAFSSR